MMEVVFIYFVKKKSFLMGFRGNYAVYQWYILYVLKCIYIYINGLQVFIVKLKREGRE